MQGNNDPGILIIMPTGVIGGAERVALNLADHLLKEGRDVSALSLTKTLTPGWDALEASTHFRWRALSFDKIQWALLPAAWQIFLLTRRHRPALVFTTHTHVNAYVSVLRRLGLCRTPVHVARESTSLFRRMTGMKLLLIRMLYACYSRVDLLICQTGEMREQLLEAVPALSRGRIQVIPNPVNLAAIDEMVAADIAVEPAEFVFCGRLIPLKRVDLILRALARLDPTTWKIAHIVGDGPEAGPLRELAVTLGLENKIRFHGAVANPFVFYKAARVGVSASTIEGFPNVLLEMMATGLDRIVSSLSTPSVAALPGVAIVDPIDESRLAEALAEGLAGPSRGREYRGYVEAHRSIAAFWETVRRDLPSPTAP